MRLFFTYKNTLKTDIALWVVSVYLMACNPQSATETTNSHSKKDITFEKTDSILPIDVPLELSQDSLIKDSATVKVPDTVSADSAKHAYDRLAFGMKKVQVDTLNKKRQKIGKHDYSFAYAFNQAGELYAVTLVSDEAKVINYEALQGRYTNLYTIISSKYGKPKGSNALPSVFDVMNAGTYWMNKWTVEGKQISLGIKERKLDSYIVICRIASLPMEKKQKEQQYKIKNRDMIEAAEKF